MRTIAGRLPKRQVVNDTAVYTCLEAIETDFNNLPDALGRWETKRNDLCEDSDRQRFRANLSYSFSLRGYQEANTAVK